MFRHAVVLTAGRCALNYGSELNAASLDQAVYNRLSSTKVFCSDSIEKEVKLVVDGKIYGSQTIKGRLHIVTLEDCFEIYLPRDDKERELCMYRRLPQELASIFGVPDSIGLKVLGDILQAKLILIEDLLTENGVIPLPEYSCQVTPQVSLEDDSRSEKDQRAFEGSTIALNSPSSDRQQPDFSLRSASPLPTPSSLLSGTFRRNPRSEPKQASVTAYHRLLDKIIKAARETMIPTGSPASVDGSQNIFGPTGVLVDNLFGDRAEDQFIYDSKIGAAGELFVSSSSFPYLITLAEDVL